MYRILKHGDLRFCPVNYFVNLISKVFLFLQPEEEEEPDETKSLQQAMLDYLAYNGASEPAYLVCTVFSAVLCKWNPKM